MNRLRLLTALGPWMLLVYAINAEPVGTIVDLAGTVTVTSAGRTAAAAKGRGINVGDRIETKAPPSFVQINFADKSSVKLGPNSELVVAFKGKIEKEFGLLRKKKRTVDSTLLDLNLGEGLFNVERFNKRTTSYEVRTPNAVAGVRGTRWLQGVRRRPGAPLVTVLTVLRGRVKLTVLKPGKRRGRGVVVRRGRQASVTGADNPSPPKRAPKPVLKRAIQFGQGMVPPSGPAGPDKKKPGEPGKKREPEKGKGPGVKPAPDFAKKAAKKVANKALERARKKKLLGAREKAANRKTQQPKPPDVRGSRNNAPDPAANRKTHQPKPPAPPLPAPPPPPPK